MRRRKHTSICLLIRTDAVLLPITKTLLETTQIGLPVNLITWISDSKRSYRVIEDYLRGSLLIQFCTILHCVAFILNLILMPENTSFIKKVKLSL